MTEIKNLAEFEQTSNENPGLIVIDFYATWCGPCKIMSPVYENLSKMEELSQVKFIKIDRDENVQLIEKYGFIIPSIPRFFVIKSNGSKLEILEDLGGTQSKTSLFEKISKYLNDNSELQKLENGSEKSQINSKYKPKVAIIGSGPAGLTAALYTSRANLNVTVFSGPQPGGQLTTTTDIENFPGFWDVKENKGKSGTDLVETIRQQAEHFGTKVEFSEITQIQYHKIDSKNQFILTDSGKQKHEFEAVIIASGASARYLGIPDESKYIGQGYHSCATCDGSFYKNQIVAIVGGGDSAMEEANFLTNFASKVYLLHRSSTFRASKVMYDRVKKNPKIEIITNVIVKDLVGEKSLDHIILENTIDGVNPELEKLKLDEIDRNRFKLKLDGLFVAIGHDPNTKFVENLLDKDSAGYLVPQSRLPKEERTSKYDSATKIPGLFVAGDVEDQLYRQAITAAAGGCRAAMETEKWLADQE